MRSITAMWFECKVRYEECAVGQTSVMDVFERVVRNPEDAE